MAQLTFTNAYLVNAATTPVGKESNSHDFIYTSLGTVTIQDDAASLQFSGNDVAAVGLQIHTAEGTLNYYGWISRPIKVGGQVKGFYFWTDNDFHSVSDATLDGNHDGDDNVNDNVGFILVVDQNYFTNTLGLGKSAGAILNVGSSSDRVDNALNALIPTNVAPVANTDTASATESGWTNNTTVQPGVNPTGNVLTNDNDANSTDSPADTKTVTLVGTSAATQTVATSTNSSTGTQVTGLYGVLTLGSDGSYSYILTNTNATVEALRAGDTLSERFTYTMRDTAGLTSTSTLTVTINGTYDRPVANNDYNTAKESIETVESAQYGASDILGRKAIGNVLTNDTDKDARESVALGGSTGITGTTGSAVTSASPTTPTSTSFIFASNNSTFNPVGNGDEAWVLISGTYRALFTSGGTQITATGGYSATTGSIPVNGAAATYYDPVAPGNRVSITSLAGLSVGFKNSSSTTTETTGSMKIGTMARSENIASSVTVTLAGLDGAIAVGMSVSGSGVPAGTTISSITRDGSNNITSIAFDKVITSTSSTTLTFTGSADSTIYGQYGTLLLEADGDYTYTPYANNSSLGAGATGVDSFKYTMHDSGGLTSSATLFITVSGSDNSDPNAKDDAYTYYEAGGTANGTAGGTDPTSLNIITADTTPSGTKSVKYVRAAGDSANTTMVAGETEIVGLYGSAFVTSAGAFRYVINQGNATVQALQTTASATALASLTDTFVYTLKNGVQSGGVDLVDTATITITIAGTNDNPVAAVDSGSVREAGGLSNAVAGLSATGNVLSNDSDVDNTAAQLSVTAVGKGNSPGTGAAANLGTVLAGDYGNLTLNSDGTWSYAVTESKTDSLAAGATALDYFNYTLSDGVGGTGTTNAILTITVTGAADTVAVNSVFVNEGPNNYAVFKVTGAVGMSMTLALSNSTGLTAADVKASLGTDLSSQLEYYNGTTWVNYGSSVSIPAGGTLLVRVAITQDNLYEGNEAFSLVATTSDTSVAYGIGTINDEGQGVKFLSTNTTGDSDGNGSDNDTPTISVTGGTVVEGGDAVFTVSIDKASVNATRFVPVLANGTAVVGTDTSSQLYVSTNGGSSYTPVSGAVSIPALSTSILLKIATTDDTDLESSETFTLSTGYIDTVVNQSGASGTFTITDNDNNATLSVDSPTVAEGAFAVFTVSLSQALGSATSFTPSLSNGTATVGTDTAASSTLEVSTDGGTVWSTVSGAVTIAAGQTALKLRVATTDDAIVEGSEAFTLTTGTVTGSVSNTTGASGTATITDNDTSAISVSSPTVTEGSAATFTVSLGKVTSTATSFTPSLSNGTATIGTDTAASTALQVSTDAGANWSTVSGAVTIAAGQSSILLRIATTDDAITEGSETFTLSTGTVTGQVTNTTGASGTATITDNDTSTLSVSSPTVTEGGVATFTVSLDKATSTATSFTPSLSNGSATIGTDTAASTTLQVSTDGGTVWNTVSGAVTIAAGQTSLLLRIATTDDPTVEGTETFTLSTGTVTGQVTNTTGATGTATILDDDSATLVVDSPTVAEGSSAVFAVSLTKATASATSFTPSLSNGTATVGTDTAASTTLQVSTDGGTVWNTVSGAVTIAAGQTSLLLRIATTDDAIVEGSETFTLSTGTITGDVTNTSGTSGTATITDNDTSTISVSSPTVTEGSVAAFTVSLGKVTSTATSFTPSLSNGTATVGTDTAASTTLEVSTDGGTVWNTVSGAVTIAAGQSSLQLRIATTDDVITEGSEAFTLSTGTVTGQVTNTTGASGTATITDNDTSTISVSSPTVTEGSAATFTVSLDKATSTATSFTPSLSNGTATIGTDTAASTALQVSTDGGTNWNTVAGAVTIAAGQTSLLLRIATTDDAITEGTEAFTLSTGTVTGQVTNATGASGTATITDNDTSTISVSSPTVTEGGVATFTVSLDKATSTATSFAPSLSNGTATVGTDTAASTSLEVSTDGGTNWNTVSGAVTIAAGQTSLLLRIATTDDVITEGPEAFTLSTGTVTGQVTNTTGASGTATILDNDSSTLAVDSPTVAEGSSAVFTVSLTKATTTATSFTPSLSNGTATIGTDTADSTALQVSTDGGTNWNAVSGAVTIAAGQTSLLLRIATTDDVITEGSETFTLSTGTVTGDVTNTTGASGTATITDNDTSTISVSSPTVTEGSAATFTVSLNKTTSTATSFTPGLSNGSATIGTDTAASTALEVSTDGGANWNTVSGAVTIAAGQTSLLLRIATTDDVITEGTEAFTLSTGTVTGQVTNTTGASGTATITDNDTSTVSVSSPAVTEGSLATFTVSLDKATSTATSFTPSVSNGTATIGTDTAASTALQVSTDGGTNWNMVSGAVTIAAGQTSLLLRIATTDDVITEASEAFTLSTGTVTGQVTNTTGASGTATITDNDTSTISVSSPTVTEGGTVTFTVSLDKATSTATSFAPSLSNGTATIGTDTAASTTLEVSTDGGANWNTVSGAVTIAAGQSSLLLRIATSDDAITEGTEAFTLSTGTVTGQVANTTGASGTATITDNDASTISVSSPTVAEGSAATFTVSLNKATSTATTFTPSLSNGTATIGTDTAASTALEVSTDAGANWNTVSGAVTIAAGQSSLLLRIATTDDVITEGTEAFTLSTGTVTGQVTNTTGASGTATITDNDTSTISVSSPTVTEGNIATFTVSLNKATSTATSFTPSLSNGTATVGTDTAASTTLEVSTDGGTNWNTVSGAVTIAAGQTSLLLRVATTDDAITEGSEAFTLSTGTVTGQVTNTTGASGTATITDNDTSTIFVNSPTVSEGSTATFTVSLNKATSTATSFTPSLSNGTATVGTDTAASTTLEVSTDGGGNWSTVSGAVTIAAGQTSLLLRIATTDDSITEGSEAFTLSTGTVTGQVTNTTGATGTATITDDDTSTISVSSPTVTEGSPATFTVSLDNATSTATSFTPGLSNGTATIGTDTSASTNLQVSTDGGTNWTTVSGAVTIAAGQKSLLLRIATTDDVITEGAEAFTLSTGTVTGQVTNTTGASGTATITDNDTSTIGVSSPTVTEGSAATFTVSLSKATSTATSFTPALSNGTATIGTDTAASTALEVSTDGGTNWNTVSGAVTIAAGQTSLLLRIGTTDDVITEGSEAFTLSTGTVTGQVTNTSGASGTATITDNDTSTISVSSPTVTEGSTAVFTVSLNKATSTATSFTPSLSNATATVGTDTAASTSLEVSNDGGTNWNTVSGAVTIAAGQTSLLLRIATTDDVITEGSEAFTLSTGTVTGQVTNTTGASGTATITDNDTSTISVSSPTVTEGSTATFTVSLNKATSTATSFTPSLSNGTATIGTDTAGSSTLEVSTDGGTNWNTVSGAVTIAAGQTSLLLRIATTDDAIVEGSEAFTLLTGPVTGQVTNTAGASGTATITDNDTSAISVSSPTVAEGGNAVFTVSLGKATSTATSFTPSLSNGTATVGTDTAASTALEVSTDGGTNWNTVSGAVSIAAGQTSLLLRIATTDDVITEGSEAFTLSTGTVTGQVTNTSGASGTATITDNDTSTISVSSPTVTEAGTATFTVSLNKATSTATSFTPSLSSGTATIGTDTAASTTLQFSTDGGTNWNTVSGAVTIAAGQTSLLLRIATTDDAIVEGSEAFTLSTGTVTGQVTNTTGATGTATILDDDSTTLVIDSPTVAEGSSAVFTVSLTKASASTTSFTPALSNGSATVGTDTAASTTLEVSTDGGTNWNTVSGAVNIAAGATSLLLRVATTDDAITEGPEAFSLSSGTVTGSVTNTSGASGTATITDNDTSTISVSSPTVTEGGTATFTVSLNKVTSTATSFTPSLSNGTATIGTDTAASTTLEVSTDGGTNWNAVSGAVSIAAGQGSLLLRIATTDDAITEGTEAFTLATGTVTGQVTNTSGASGTATITDNDTSTISVSSPTVAEGGNAVFTVSLNKATSTATTFTPSLSNGTATIGTDTAAATLLQVSTDGGTNWTTVSGAVTLAAGQTSLLLRIATTDDVITEGSEAFTLSTGTVTGQVTNTSGASGTATITDNDTSTISVSSPTVTEGSTATFTVSLDKATSTATSFTPSLSSGTATIGTDTAASTSLQVSTDGGTNWNTVSGAVTIAAGQTSLLLRIATTDDATTEGSETFTLSTGSVTGQVTNTTGASGTATITDNDTSTISVSSPTVAEGSTAVFTVSLNKATSTATSFTPSLANGTATVGTDTAASTTLEVSTDGGTSWNTASGAVTIAAGQTSLLLRIATTDDAITEGMEAFTLSTGTVTGQVTNTSGASGTATITDNDTSTISVSSPTVTEGGTPTFMVSLDKATSTATSFTPSLSNGTATIGTDTAASTSLQVSTDGGTNWNTVAGAVTIAAGQTSLLLRIATTDDAIVEGSEAFTLLTGPVTGQVTNTAGASGTATITDNDTSAISVSSPTVTEGGNAVFTVSLTKATSTATTFTPALSSGTATIGTDTAASTALQVSTDGGTNWSTVSGAVSIAAGQTSLLLRIATSDDTIVEGPEAFTLSTGTVTGQVTNTTGATGTATITDNDVPTLTVTGKPDVSEGSNAVFTLTLTGSATIPIDVALLLADGTALGASDYAAASATAYYYTNAPTPVKTALAINAGVVTVPAGVGTFFVSVPTTNDSPKVFEGPESFTLKGTVSAPGSSTSTGTSTIVDDGSGRTYDPKGDPDPNATPDDDRTITLTGTPTVSEGSRAVFKAVLSAASPATTPITLSLANGTAQSGDYASNINSATAHYYDTNGDKQLLAISGGKVTVAANVTTFYVSVGTTDDNPAVYEGPETFSLTASVTNGQSSDSKSVTILDDGTGKIYDEKGVESSSGTPDNDKASISVVGEADVSEGSDAIFTVTLSTASDLVTEIALSLGSGADTTEAGDYSSAFGAYYYAGATKLPLTVTAGKVSLPAGVTQFYVNVATTADSPKVYEGPETFTLNALITGGDGDSGTSTILDDGTGKVHDDKGVPTAGAPDNDKPGIAVAGKADVSEGSNAIFTVTLSNASDLFTEISLALGAGGDTTEAGDYSTAYTAHYYAGLVQVPLAVTGGKVSLPAGVTTFYVSVATTADAPPVYEGPETFTLAAAITGGASASGTSTILDNGQGKVYDGKGDPTFAAVDNDIPKVTVTGQPDVSEGSNAVFTVTLSNTSETTTPVVLQLGAAGDSAVAGDYSATMSAYYYFGLSQQVLPILGNTVQVPAGITSFFVKVATTNDTPPVYEGPETFTLTATGPGGISDDDTSTIRDDGTGKVHDDKGLPIAGTPDDDRGSLAVVGTANVSEGSNAIFSVVVTPARGVPTTISLSLGAGTDTTEADDYSTTLTAYYFAGGVKTALPVAGGAIVLPAGVSQFYVSVPTTADTPALYEGAESFTLNAAMAGVPGASGTSTILDDGTGKVHDDTGSPTGATPDNDRGGIHVAGQPDVSEGSKAVFTVTLDVASASATEISLLLGNGTAQSTDYAPGSISAYYYAGGVKTALPMAGGKVSLPAGLTSFFVSVETTGDTPAVYEGPETFTLAASVTGGANDTGTSTILDDGTGKIHDDKGLPVAGTPDDDRPSILVAGKGDVSEGSNAVFTVTLSTASTMPTPVALALGASSDTTESGDYNSAMSAYWFNGGVKTALAISNGSVILPAGVTTFFVSVATVGDAVYEGGENFTLRATTASGASDDDKSTIVDDGSGHIYDDHATVAAGTPDDDRPALSVSDAPGVSEGTKAVFEVTLSKAADMPLELGGTMGFGSDTTEPEDLVLAGTQVYYFDGTGAKQMLTTSGSYLVLPAGVTKFYVAIPTATDSPPVLEGAEQFTLGVFIAGGGSNGSDTGTATIVDNGTGFLHDDKGAIIPGTPDNDTPAMSADLDPASDNGPSNTDHITSLLDPDFIINAGNLLVAGQTVQLLAPDGHIEGSVIVTAADVLAGTVKVPTSDLDDGTYVYLAQILQGGGLVAQSTVTVTVITDRDGVQPSIELSANGGDFNHDGVKDWEQNNVAQFPITSVANFLAGANAPDASFGAILAGSPASATPAGTVVLNDSAQLLNIIVSELPGGLALPASYQQASPVISFSVTSQDGMSLSDLDPAKPGLQTRVVIDLPTGVAANTYLKYDTATGTWFEFLDDGNLATFDDGATLLDFNNDGKIDRVVITLTDGAKGDSDGLANGIISDPGMLALKIAAPPSASSVTPVYSVLLAGGDRYYSTSATEAATMAQGTGNVFEGVRFDSLSSSLGGRILTDNYNPYTGDWYFAAAGYAMPYICYEPRPGAGFQAAAAGSGPGVDFHLFINASGQTQLVSMTEAANLGLSANGFADWGGIFRTTTTSAFVFDAEAYLVANKTSAAVQSLVQTLKASFSSTSAPGFVEAVEQHFLAQVALVGTAAVHGSIAGAADVNAAFGTSFT